MGLNHKIAEHIRFADQQHAPSQYQEPPHSGPRYPRAPFQHNQQKFSNQEPVCLFCKLPGHTIENCPHPRCRVSAAFRAQNNEPRRPYRNRNNNHHQPPPITQQQFQNQAPMQIPFAPQYVQYTAAPQFIPQYAPQYAQPNVFAPSVMQNPNYNQPPVQTQHQAASNTAGSSIQPGNTEPPKN